MDKLTTAEALPCTPTTEIRAQLEAAAVALPSDEELANLSTVFNEGFEALQRAEGTKNQGGMSWHNLFRMADADGSGVITCERAKLHFEPSAFLAA